MDIFNKFIKDYFQEKHEQHIKEVNEFVKNCEDEITVEDAEAIANKKP